jgi:hypothetical protein
MHILYSVTFFPENHAVYEIMSENVVEPERLQMAVWQRAHVLALMHPYARTCGLARARTHRNI